MKKFFDDLMIIEDDETENKCWTNDDEKYISFDKYQKDDEDENKYEKNQEKKENESNDDNNNDENVIITKIIELSD